MRHSGTWLPPDEGGPIARLSFSREDGSGGSLAEYAGVAVAVLIVSLDCAVCRAAIAGVGAVADGSGVPLLILCDRGAPPMAAGADERLMPPPAFAPLPEIYLGFGIPRGTWIKYPSLILLDAGGRVRAFSNVADEVTDPRWVAGALGRLR